MSQNAELTTFTYNGVSYPFDIEDVDDLEKYEKAYEKMSEDQKAIPKDGMKSEWVRAYCRMIRNFFDNIFGEGAGKEICGEKLNSRTDTDAYNAFLSYVATQTDAGLEQKAALSQTYLNRAQRRAAAKAQNAKK